MIYPHISPPDDEMKCLFRFLGGVGDAAALDAVYAILIVLYPNKVSTVSSCTQMLYGLGYMIGNTVILLSYYFVVIS